MAMNKTKENKSNGSGKAVIVDDFVVEYRKYRTELTEKFRKRTNWKPDDPSKVLAFIPGTITKIYVKEGDVVEPGTELMILEAMKMKNTVFSDVHAIIKKVNLKVGDHVSKGKVIFEFKLS